MAFHHGGKDCDQEHYVLGPFAIQGLTANGQLPDPHFFVSGFVTKVGQDSLSNRALSSVK